MKPSGPGRHKKGDTYTIHTQYTQFVHNTQKMHTIHTQYTQNVHDIYTMCTQYEHNTHTKRTQYAINTNYDTYTMRKQSNAIDAQGQENAIDAHRQDNAIDAHCIGTRQCNIKGGTLNVFVESIKRQFNCPQPPHWPQKRAIKKTNKKADSSRSISSWQTIYS